MLTGHLIWSLFPFQFYMLLSLITKVPNSFHFISCFQSSVKEMLKTRKSSFHHFLYKTLKARNIIKTRWYFVFINENIQTKNENRKQTKTTLF